MIPNPALAIALLKALRTAVNLYAAACERGENDEMIRAYKTTMYDCYKNVRDVIINVLTTIPKKSIPNDKIKILLLVGKSINWGYKQVILYRALERLVEELKKEDSTGKKSTLWAKLLKKTRPKPAKSRSAWKSNPPKLPPIEEDKFEDLEDDWVPVECEDITDEAWVSILKVNLDFDFIDDE